MMKNQHVNLICSLPPDIIVKIISSLPVKYIIYCMRVCKLWYTLIPNPFLAKNDPQYFLLHHENSTKFSILDHDQIIPMKPSFAGLEGMITILGSCNGLICFSHDIVDKVATIYVYNPVIGESVTIPRCNLLSKPLTKGYAFGFCVITESYKLLRCFFNPHRRELEVEIYTLGSEGWRHIGDAPRDMGDIQQGHICSGGVVHWLSCTITTPPKILTFNLAEEEFGVAPLPPIGNGERMYKLGCMDKCLIATAGRLPYTDSRMDIWVRKESSSWSKNWVVRDPLLLKHGLQFLIPITVSTDGRILIIHSSNYKKVYSYDPRNNTSEISNLCSCVLPLDATLVSPRDLMMEGTSLENKAMKTNEENISNKSRIELYRVHEPYSI